VSEPRQSPSQGSKDGDLSTSKVEVRNNRREALLTNNVFVDTCVHVGARFAYADGDFARLAVLAEHGMAKVFETPIDREEIRGKIREQAKTIRASLRRFQKEGRALAASTEPSMAALARRTTIEEVEKTLRDGHERFGAQGRVVSVPIHAAGTLRIFDDYFAERAPFGRGEKKSEFPDAFIAAALAEWCSKNGERMYVVSNDQGLREAAASTESLIPLASLDRFLDLVVTKEHGAAVVAIHKWLRENQDSVARRITEAFENLGFYLDDVDGDVEDVVTEDVHLGEPLIVEVDKEAAVAELPCDIVFECDISYWDPDTATYDSEDGSLFYHHRAELRVRASIESTAECRVTLVPPEGKQKQPMGEGWKVEVARVEVNDGRDVPVSRESEIVETYPEDIDDDQM
jgi:hypothetical protein